MIKKIICVLMFSIILCCPQAYAEKINRQVVLNTTIYEAEQILLNLISLYPKIIELDKIDKENHIYTVKYNLLKLSAIYSKQNSQDNTFTYGGYSCQLTQLENNKDVLITCRKYCLSTDYIYSHYKKYYRELRLNGKQVVPYNKYLKNNTNTLTDNWTQINDDWYVDIDSCERKKDSVAIWSKTNVSKKNIRTKNNKKVYWITYKDIFFKGENLHLTTTEILYDKNMKVLEKSTYPYGKTASEFPNNCTLEVIRDIAFLTPQQINDIKAVLEMGIIKPKIFSPYIEVSNPNNYSLEEVRQKEKEFKNIIENIEEPHYNNNVLQENSVVILKNPLKVRYGLFEFNNDYARPFAKIPTGIKVKLLKKCEILDTSYYIVEWYSSSEKKTKTGIALEYAIKSSLNLLTKSDKEQISKNFSNALANYQPIYEIINKKNMQGINQDNYMEYIEDLRKSIISLFIQNDISNENAGGANYIISEIYGDMAMIYATVGQLENATKCAEESAYYNKDNVYLRGQLYMQQGYYSKAKTDFLVVKKIALSKGNESLAIKMNEYIKTIDKELNKLK